MIPDPIKSCANCVNLEPNGDCTIADAATMSYWREFASPESTTRQNDCARWEMDTQITVSQLTNQSHD